MKTVLLQQAEKALLGEQEYVVVQVVQFVCTDEDVKSPKIKSAGVFINEVQHPVNPSATM